MEIIFTLSSGVLNGNRTIHTNTIANIMHEFAIMSVSTLLVMVMATTAMAGPADKEKREIQDAATFASVRL